MAFIVGCDISNAQGQIDWETFKNNTNFVVMKASEGTGYIDTWFGGNRQQARNAALPRGFYHFARPDLGNSALEEAKYFCDLIDGDPIVEGEILALDFEVNFSDPVGWSKVWLDEVSSHFGGIKPFVYLNQSTATSYDWSSVSKDGYPLWIAAYTYDPSNNNFETGSFGTAAMQQWTDKEQVPGITGDTDGDVFFGDETQFKKYGFSPTQAPSPSNPSDPCSDYKTRIDELTEKLITVSGGFSVLQKQFDDYKTTHPVVVVTNNPTPATTTVFPTPDGTGPIASTTTGSISRKDASVPDNAPADNVPVNQHNIGLFQRLINYLIGLFHS